MQGRRAGRALALLSLSERCRIRLINCSDVSGIGRSSPKSLPGGTETSLGFTEAWRTGRQRATFAVGDHGRSTEARTAGWHPVASEQAAEHAGKRGALILASSRHSSHKQGRTATRTSCRAAHRWPLR